MILKKKKKIVRKNGDLNLGYLYLKHKLVSTNWVIRLLAKLIFSIRK